MQVINQNIACLLNSTINIFLYFPFLLLRKLISTVSLLNNGSIPQEAPIHIGCKITFTILLTWLKDITKYCINIVLTKSDYHYSRKFLLWVKVRSLINTEAYIFILIVQFLFDKCVSLDVGHDTAVIYHAPTHSLTFQEQRTHLDHLTAKREWFYINPYISFQVSNTCG